MPLNPGFNPYRFGKVMKTKQARRPARCVHMNTFSGERRLNSTEMKTQLLLGVVLSFSVSTLKAQTNDEQFSTTTPDTIVTFSESVTVTASRFPLKQSQTGKVVSVLQNDWLFASEGQSLGRLLQQLPGIYSTGGYQTKGSTQEIFLRGADQGDLLIMIDGIPVSDASQIDQRYDLQFIDPQSIERIEVLKGAQSTLWGSNAVAGVIHILTKEPGNNPFSGSVSAGVGSFGNQSIRSSIGLNKAGWKAQFTGQIEQSDGFNATVSPQPTGDEDRDGFSSATGQWNISKILSSGTSLSYRGSFQGYEADLDGGAGIDDRDYTANHSHQHHALSFQTVTERSTIRVTQQLQITDRTFLNDSTHKTGFTDWSKGDYASKEAITDAYWTNKWTPTITSVVGAQVRWNATTQSFRSFSSFGPFESQPLNESNDNTTTIAGFGSLLWQPFDRFSLEVGTRLTSHSTFGEHLTYSFNPLWSPLSNIDLFVNISSGFRAPSLYQLYSEYGTLSLSPETSINTEVGVSIYSNAYGTMARIVAYQRDIENAIEFVTDKNFISSYQNVGSEFNRGIEMEVESFVGKSLQMAANVTYQEGHRLQNGRKQNTAIRRPNMMGGLRMLWRPSPQWTLTSSAQYIGSREKGPFDPGPETLDEAWLFGAQVKWAPLEAWSISASIMNAFDTSFTEIPGYRSAGRHGFVRLMYTL